MNLLWKTLTLLFLIFIFLVLPKNLVYSDTSPSPSPSPSPSDNNQIQDLKNKINDLQNKITDLQGQEKTLSSQIALLDSQVKLTEYRIEVTKEQIASLSLDIDTTSKKISNLQSQLNDSIGILINRIRATYEVGTIQPFQILLSSSDVANFFNRLNYLKIAQAHDKNLIYNTEQAKTDYSNQKVIFEDKRKKITDLKKQLEDYTTQLASEKQQKQDLLAQTQGSEANYQQLLAQTKAQLASFSNFVQSQGGASLVDSQPGCNSWGCYYNQRDRQWGGLALNGTGYSLAGEGCLITSMAMVYTHYGHKDVTPAVINSISSNFSGIPPDLLNLALWQMEFLLKELGKILIAH
jgi:peptidoglycan hydrolase CwlO-like protein